MLTAGFNASLDAFVDPVTHVPFKAYYFNLSLDGTTYASGIRYGSISETLSQQIGYGYHGLQFGAYNSYGHDQLVWTGDIQNFSRASSAQVVFGHDETAGSVNVDLVYGSRFGDAFFLGQNDDTVDAGGGNDYIDGGTGADLMIGGLGSDVYVVDDVGDRTVEAFHQGVETVFSSIDWTLADNVEELRLTGGVAVNATGNALGNIVAGNELANVVSGLEGNDKLYGNGGADRLDGGAGADLLDGGAGADLLHGGAGNDTYVVDSGGDRVVENAGGGVDTVRSSVAYTLGAEVENLYLTGSYSYDGVGNAKANSIYGNDGYNQLNGGGGNDRVFGGEGKDTLFGGDGDDRLNGGADLDSLRGGGGNDTFEFLATSDSLFGSEYADRINDFSFGDMIDVSAIDADETIDGNQAFVFDADGTFSAGELRQQVTGNTTVVTFNTDGDPAAEMMLIVNGARALSADAFFL